MSLVNDNSRSIGGGDFSSVCWSNIESALIEVSTVEVITDHDHLRVDQFVFRVTLAKGNSLVRRI